MNEILNKHLNFISYILYAQYNLKFLVFRIPKSAIKKPLKFTIKLKNILMKQTFLIYKKLT